MPGARLIIPTGRFMLRALDETANTDAFQRWAADPRIMTPMNLPARALSAQQVRDYWAGFDHQSRYFLGIFDSQNRPAGFWLVECDPVHTSAMLQIAIDPAYRGAGVMLETIIGLFDWLFGQRGMEKIVVLTLAQNRHVLAAMNLCGFQREGILRQEVRSFTGPGRLDQIRGGLLPDDWRRCRPALLEKLKQKSQWRSRALKKEVCHA